MIDNIYLVYHQTVDDWSDINTRYAVNHKKDIYRCIIGIADKDNIINMAFDYIHKKHPDIELNKLNLKYNDKLNQFYIQFIQDYTNEFIIMKPYKLNVIDKDLTDNDLIPIQLVEKINENTHKSEFLQELADVKFGWIVGKDIY